MENINFLSQEENIESINADFNDDDFLTNNKKSRKFFL